MAAPEIKTAFLRSLCAPAIDRSVYERDFIPLAAERAFLNRCLRVLRLRNTRHPGEGLSRIAFLLALAGRPRRALLLWEKDIEARRIGWWQHTQYMLTRLRARGGLRAALRVAKRIEAEHPDAMNVYGNLGFAMCDARPRSGLKWLAYDAARGRLTAGFLLNYAQALARAGRLTESLAQIELAASQNPALLSRVTELGMLDRAIFTPSDIKSLAAFYMRNRSSRMPIEFLWPLAHILAHGGAIDVTTIILDEIRTREPARLNVHASVFEHALKADRLDLAIDLLRRDRQAGALADDLQVMLEVLERMRSEN